MTGGWLKTLSVLMTTATLLLTACSPGFTSETPAPPDAFDCADLKVKAAESVSALMTASAETRVLQVTLRSNARYGYGEGTYNLSGNCFSRKGDCEARDQLLFENGEGTGLNANGDFILLDADAAGKFDQISLDTLDDLQLKTAQGVPVSRDSLFGKPSRARPLAVGDSKLEASVEGTVALLLLNETNYGNKGHLQLFKLRVDRRVPGEEIQLSYQRVAEASPEGFRAFRCAQETRVKTARSDRGEAFAYSSRYSGLKASSFGFDYGVNGFDGHYVRSEQVLHFNEPEVCADDPSRMCVVARASGVAGDLGRIIEASWTTPDAVNRLNWPNPQPTDPESARMELREGRTYLVSLFTRSTFTFGAIRVLEIDAQRRWTRFEWKRVAIEAPWRFIRYTPVKIPTERAFGEATLTAKWWTESHFDIAFAKRNDDPLLEIRTEMLHFEAGSNSLVVDNDYFPSHSGVVDLGRSFTSSVATVPEDVANDLTNRFSRDVPLRPGHTYIVATERFHMRAVLALRVLELLPGRAVRFEYKRLYNGQTIPGLWKW